MSTGKHKAFDPKRAQSLLGKSGRNQHLAGAGMKVKAFMARLDRVFEFLRRTKGMKPQ